MAITDDVNVIMIGNGMSDQPCQKHHLSFLNAFFSSLYLALDSDGHIKVLYEQKLGSASLGMKWLTSVLIKERVQFFPLGKIDKSTRVKLEEEHFDRDDVPYVRLAMNTTDHHLVTEDPDFSPKIKRIIKKSLGVVVRDTVEACEHLGIA